MEDYGRNSNKSFSRFKILIKKRKRTEKFLRVNLNVRIKNEVQLIIIFVKYI